ncbi:selenocysteine-specific elongation factor-like [Tropilaelaps mercedesae]|uniref:Selenocysteine-specific elongation factor-like n=1 Tax=Tropilaelaps mercedesae TaxID=418985 RepID=A0A1V9WYB4_9ACAR|nr:selenocysteine-specific elongation factor-like [Tropilaelaps mercedesae]
MAPCRFSANINVGVLGHVDSGKTSLCRALSDCGSTAAFDKNSQSRQRGITIDLGFSAFSHGDMHFTLVDCPGHASLIRTVIGGAQIIDVMMLVIDVTKGVQTQTAECLIIGEICCDKVVVVLNKIDLLKDQQTDIDKVCRRLAKTLETTKFKGAEMIPVSAAPGANPSNPGRGINELKDVLTRSVSSPQRSPDGPLLFCVDHCFQIKGQGTVLTGTITQGSISVNSMIDIPSLKLQRKVKSMQMFREPVNGAIQGDRVGICVPQLDAKLFERGVVCSPGYLQLTYAVIAPLSRISYFRHGIRSGAKFHVTAVHDTVLAKVTFFSSDRKQFSGQEMLFEEELPKDRDSKAWFGLMEFEQPMICGEGGLLLGSRLDTDVHTKACRLAFYGNAVKVFTTPEYRANLSEIRVFKFKCKTGVVDRVPSDSEVIIKDMFKKETNIELFTGMKVTFSSGETGTIQGSFGKSGKTKVQLDFGQRMTPELARYRNKKENNGDSLKEDIASAATITEKALENVRVVLQFKRFVFDVNKKIVQ